MEKNKNCTGWLTKSPPLAKASKKASWKKRFFHLDYPAQKLHYFEDEKKEKSLKSINLNECNKLGMYDNYETYGEDNAPFLKKHRSANIICLATNSRTYFFTADCKEEMEKWYNALKKVLMQIGCIEEEKVEDWRHTYNGSEEDKYRFSQMSSCSAPGVLEYPFSSGDNKQPITNSDSSCSLNSKTSSRSSWHSATSNLSVNEVDSERVAAVPGDGGDHALEQESCVYENYSPSEPGMAPHGSNVHANDSIIYENLLSQATGGGEPVMARGSSESSGQNESGDYMKMSALGPPKQPVEDDERKTGGLAIPETQPPGPYYPMLAEKVFREEDPYECPTVLRLGPSNPQKSSRPTPRRKISTAIPPRPLPDIPVTRRYTNPESMKNFNIHNENKPVSNPKKTHKKLRDEINGREYVEVCLPLCTMKRENLAFGNVAGLKDSIWILGWTPANDPNLCENFCVGDMLVSINGIPCKKVKDAHKLIKLATENQPVEDGKDLKFEISRVPGATLVTFEKTRNNEDVGLRLDSTEITSITKDSPAGKARFPSITNGIDGNACNWVITEINMKPVDLFSNTEEVKKMLESAGTKITLMLQSADKMNALRRALKQIKDFRKYCSDNKLK